jgi:16S rRNA (cytosine1402-N4)-methyltransferase
MTPYKHQPVLSAEVVELLVPQPGQVLVDATIGLGGHAAALLPRLGKKGKLIGIDQDDRALQIVRENLSPYQSQLVLVCGNFADIDELVKGTGNFSVDGILFDLGVSSYQLDDANRGFSFNKSARLDMRMGAGGISAFEVVNQYAYDDLVRILADYGEEPRAKEIAQAIVAARKRSPIATTGQLVEVVGGKSGRVHPATRTFQAIRIEVNDEITALKRALPQAFNLLKPGGRLAVISFHSLEDRPVKHFFKILKTGGSAKLLTKKAITPSWPERSSNPRARSAKLRVIEKL